MGFVSTLEPLSVVLVGNKMHWQGPSQAFQVGTAKTD